MTDNEKAVIEAWEDARSELDASLYALHAVRPALEKIGGPCWDEVLAGFDRARNTMDEAFQLTAFTAGTEPEKPCDCGQHFHAMTCAMFDMPPTKEAE